jgi:hypothetical protein
MISSPPTVKWTVRKHFGIHAEASNFYPGWRLRRAQKARRCLTPVRSAATCRPRRLRHCVRAPHEWRHRDPVFWPSRSGASCVEARWQEAPSRRRGEWRTAPVHIADLFAVGNLESNYSDGRLQIKAKIGSMLIKIGYDIALRFPIPTVGTLLKIDSRQPKRPGEASGKPTTGYLQSCSTSGIHRHNRNESITVLGGKREFQRGFCLDFSATGTGCSRSSFG